MILGSFGYMSKLIKYKTNTYLFSGSRAKRVNTVTYYIPEVRHFVTSQITKTDITCNR